jgi:hypothetical protein
MGLRSALVRAFGRKQLRMYLTSIGLTPAGRHRPLIWHMRARELQAEHFVDEMAEIVAGSCPPVVV